MPPVWALLGAPSGSLKSLNSTLSNRLVTGPRADNKAQRWDHAQTAPAAIRGVQFSPCQSLPVNATSMLGLRWRFSVSSIARSNSLGVRRPLDKQIGFSEPPVAHVAHDERMVERDSPGWK